MRTGMLQGSGMLSNRLYGNQFELPRHKRLTDLKIDSFLELVPESVARECQVLPVDFDGETITFVAANDTDIMLQDKLRFILNRNVRFIARDRNEILQAINHFYGQVTGASADSMLQDFSETDFDLSDDFCEHESIGKLVAELSPLELRDSAYDSTRSSYQAEDIRNGIMFYTIAEGKRVVAYRPNGEMDILAGPARVWKGRTRFQPMNHFVAHPGQYLSIRFSDGREETVVGPAELWQDPRIHESVNVQECLELAAKEAVVVYGPAENPEQGVTGTSRRIVCGPGQFAPHPGEWLHRFSWHASHGGSRGEEKRPNALQFHKLWLMPDQMYHDVRDVRTADDAVLTIRLMIFFELGDIQRMLDTTHDPIGDFINAATSDVVEFTGKRSFDQFKQQTEQLNELSTYHQLLHRAEQCGYQINNVVYRGYGAPDSLQAMHDEAIQMRTRLQLEKATEQQAQELEDYKLSCQMERTDRRRTEQMTEVEHDLEMKRRQAEAELRQQEQQGEFLRAQRRAEEELGIQVQQQRDQQKQAHLEALQAMNVNLTEYLTQARADQIIEVRGSGDVTPQLHLDNGQRKTVPR